MDVSERRWLQVGTVKDFLLQIRKEQKELSQLNDKIREIELSLLPSAIRYDTDKVQTSPDDPMLQMLAVVADYKADMVKRVELLTKRRRKAFALINTLEDSRQRQVLQLYFLDPGRLRMYQVAERIGYTDRETYRFYQAGLDILSVNVSKHI